MAKNKTKMVATKKSLRQRMYEYRWIYFLGIPGESIPSNSILREFIGGGCFDV